MTQTITGLYDDHASAEAAVRDLKTLGIPDSEISLVASNADKRYGSDATNEAGQDAGIGAGVGAGVGGAAGLLTGLGLLAIPGVGPVVAAGWLVSAAVGALAGATVGGAAGGIVGAMTEAGIRQDHAHVYAEGVRRGGTLVSARVEDDRSADAEAVLARHKSIDPEARGRAYHEQGWDGFDAKAPAYSSAEIERDRTNFRQ